MDRCQPSLNFFGDMLTSYAMEIVVHQKFQSTWLVEVYKWIYLLKIGVCEWWWFKIVVDVVMVLACASVWKSMHKDLLTRPLSFFKFVEHA